MSEWREVELGELCQIKGGKRLPKGEQLSESPTDHPYIRTRDLGNNKIAIHDLLFVPNEVFPVISRYIVEAGDIIISIVGTIGLVARIPEELHLASLTENCAKLVQIDDDVLYKEFLFYFLISGDGQDEIDQRNVGSTQPKLPLYNIKTIPIPIPPLPEQKDIAEVLSSLDDKIDLLHRQNKTLEQMAETLFRQWFVEEAQEDWEELGSVVETKSGGTPSRKKMEFYDGGKYSWIKSKELIGGFILETEEQITEEALNNSSAKLLPKHSILIAMYGATVGEYGIISKQMTCNQAICALQPNENYPYSFLFMFIKTMKNEIVNMAVGSAQQNISQILIKKLPIHAPSERIIEYHNKTKDNFSKIEENQQQIRTLESLRDTLLPKLMSGEVRIASHG